MIHPLRTKKTHQKYEKFKIDGFLPDKCNLCQETDLIKEFRYWKVMDNLFPYDRVAKIHHMIIPKRHVIYEKLSKVEKKELDSIKSTYIEKEYEITMEATNRKKSIPQHFHLHLIIFKE